MPEPVVTAPVIAAPVVAAPVTQSTESFKFDFTNPEIKETFPKMFPGMKMDPDTIGKTMIEQQRLIGQKGVQLPTKPEDFPVWAQTHLKTPKDGKGYKFDDIKIPDGLPVNKDQMAAFGDTFAKHGMTQEQVKGVMEDYYSAAAIQHSTDLKARNDMAETSKATLEKKWGTDYQKKMTGAEMALANLGGPELVEAVTKSGLQNDHRFVEFLANAAELMKEDTATGKLSTNGYATGPMQAQQEIDILYADKKFMDSYTNANDPGYALARSRMERLFKIKHGEIGRK